jgi:hypothetical protein
MTSFQCRRSIRLRAGGGALRRHDAARFRDLRMGRWCPRGPSRGLHDRRGVGNGYRADVFAGITDRHAQGEVEPTSDSCRGRWLSIREADFEDSTSAIDRSTTVRVAPEPDVDEEHVTGWTHGDTERTVIPLRYRTSDLRRLARVIEPPYGVATAYGGEDVGHGPAVGAVCAAGGIACDAGWDAEPADKYAVWGRGNQEAVRTTVLRPARERPMVEPEDAPGARLRGVKVVCGVHRHESRVAQAAGPVYMVRPVSSRQRCAP